jgi:hypothetical protein
MRKECHSFILLIMLLEVLGCVVPRLIIKAAEHRNSRNVKCSSVYLALAYHEGIQMQWTKETRVLYMYRSSMNSC